MTLSLPQSVREWSATRKLEHLNYRRDRDAQFVSASFTIRLLCSHDGRPDSLHVFHIRAQNFCHTPRLCDASARPVRGVGFEDLGDVTQPSFGKMTLQRLEPFGGLLPSCIAASVHLYIGSNEWPQEPRPYRSLVVSTIAFERAASVVAFILWIAWSKAAQTERRQQMLAHLFDHTLRALRGQHAVRQAHRENLVRANGGVRRRAVG